MISFKTGDHPFLTMVFQDGQPLGRVIRRHDNVSECDVWFPEPVDSDWANDDVFFASLLEATAFLQGAAWMAHEA